jgi:hypothetical protein
MHALTALDAARLLGRQSIGNEQSAGSLPAASDRSNGSASARRAYPRAMSHSRQLGRDLRDMFALKTRGREFILAGRAAAATTRNG